MQKKGSDEPMTMQSDPAFMTDAPSGSEPGPTPVWVWLLVVAFGALAIFGGYAALSRNQQYWESETARQTLTAEKSRLTADVSDLRQQLDQANSSKEASATALAQSRADTETASKQISDLQGQISKLQGQVSELQAKATDLESKLAAAETATKTATTAREGLERDLTATQKKLDAALADLSQAQKQSQSQLAPPAAPAPAATP